MTDPDPTLAEWPYIEDLELEGNGCYLRISIDENVVRDDARLQAQMWAVLCALGYAEGLCPTQ